MPQPLDIAQLAAVIDRVLRTLDAREDPDALYEAATEVGWLARRLSDGAAAARRRALIAIKDDEELTITALAERMGMSKGRAQQLMAHAEREAPEAPV